MDRRAALDEYLAASYPFFVTPDPDGGHVITFPDLPGCVTKVDSLNEIGRRAEQARALWLRSVYPDEVEIPLPSLPEEYSGRFNLRLPRSLHQWLAESAAAEAISLNQYVATLLARGDVQARVERRLDEASRKADEGKERGMPATETNKAIVRRFYEEIWNEGRLETADEIFPPGEKCEDLKRRVRQSRTRAVYRHTVEDLIADGDKVAAIVTVRGHQKKLALPLVGQVGAGVQFEQPEVDIFRILDGEIVGISRHLGPTQQSPGSAAGFDRFTERARGVLVFAQEEARSLGHSYIGTEHLLLGLIRQDDGVAAKVLPDLGVGLDKVRTAVELIIGRGGQREVSGAIGLTPRAKRVLELGVAEAGRMKVHYIGTEHILLGLMREGKGIAASVLKSLGVQDLDAVRAEVKRTLNST